MNWNDLIPALVALLTALVAVFGSHKRINGNLFDAIADNKEQIEQLIQELRDEFKRND